MALTKILQEGIKDGEIVNADINASAAIAKSKLASLNILNTDINASAAIASTKLAKPIDLADNEELRLGSSGDLQLFHDGSNSNIYNASGNLRIRAANNLQLETHDGEMHIKCVEDGQVELYYNNVKKFETTSSGVDIAGNCTITGNFRGNDNVKLNLGNGDDIQIFHDGTDSIIDNNTAALHIKSNTAISMLVNNSEDAIVANANGAVELYYDNSKKFQTYSTGAYVYGHLYTDDNNQHRFGNDGDLQIYHDGSNSYIKDAGTGSLLIRGSTVSIQSTSGEAMIEGVADGAVTIKHDNSTKLQTTSGGIDVTGTIDADDVIAINSSSTADLRLQYSANNRLVVRAASSSANIITQNNSDLALRHDSGTGSGTIIASVDAYGLNTGNNKRLQIKDNNGDVSGVIENWDSSANALKIGADPANGAGGSYISLQVDGSEQARIGNGISFNGDSATANFLNDYEEGTWTPIFKKNGVANPTPSHVGGTYTKIGNIVHLAGYWYLNNSSNSAGSSGYWTMEGLPFSIEAQLSGGYQFLDTGYLGINSTDYITNSSYNYNIRWQANVSGALAMYGPVAGLAWNSGYMEVAVCGVLRVD